MTKFPVEISYEGIKYSFTVQRRAPDAFTLSINGQVCWGLHAFVGRAMCLVFPNWFVVGGCGCGCGCVGVEIVLCDCACVRRCALAYLCVFVLLQELFALARAPR